MNLSISKDLENEMNFSEEALKISEKNRRKAESLEEESWLPFCRIMKKLDSEKSRDEKRRYSEDYFILYEDESFGICKDYFHNNRFSIFYKKKKLFSSFKEILKIDYVKDRFERIYICWTQGCENITSTIEIESLYIRMCEHLIEYRKNKSRKNEIKAAEIKLIKLNDFS